MRIQHNIAAMNSYRQLGGNNNALSKNLEKLSSGFRINRAGDDAAGLAISEKMRAQIKGLETAQKNANDAISMVQTAEGALTEVHSMLNRMTELATQSANGTYEDEVDRDNLQAEVDALLEEIDRISKATNFNGIELLDGTLGGPKVTSVDGTAGEGGAAAVKAAFTVDFNGVTLGNGKKITAGTTDLVTATGDMDNATLLGELDGKEATIDGVVYKLTVDGTDVKFEQKETPTTDKDVDGTAVAAQIKVADTQVDAGKVSGVQSAKKAVAPNTPGVEAKTTIDFTGLTGADLIGGKIKIGDTEYEFVEGAAGDKQISINADDEAAALVTAVKDAVDAPAGFTVGEAMRSGFVSLYFFRRPTLP